MKIFKSIIAISVMPLLAGCDTITPRSKVINMSANKIAMISSSAETSSAVFQIGAERAHYCATNSPDSTFSSSSSMGLSISMLNFGGGAPESETDTNSSTGDEMMGRTPAVLASRDIMYRACELIGNLDLTIQQALDLYSDSLKAATLILAKEVASTKVQQFSTMNSQISNGAADLSKINAAGASEPEDSNDSDSYDDSDSDDDSGS